LAGRDRRRAVAKTEFSRLRQRYGVAAVAQDFSLQIGAFVMRDKN